jgi:hypothetical protein
MARIIFGILIILLIAPFTPQIPGCIATHRSKSGKVVDVETGRGLPNALVISSARFVSDPVFFGPSGNMVLYNVIVRTDAEGRFSIPSTWSDLYIATPGTHPRITWVVTVFEPGYAVVGDEKAWLYMDDYGMPSFLPRSTAQTPELSTADQWLGNLGIIRMFKPAFTLKQAASYYSTVKGTSNPNFYSPRPDDVAIRRKGYDLLAPWVCSEDPDSDLDYSTAMSVYGFTLDRIGAIELRKKLDPGNYKKELYDRPKYKAGTMCRIITNGRGVP